MKIENILLTVSVALLTIFPVQGSSLKPLNKPWIPYNVKDYGAVGDGKTDDTDAIQRCITAVEKKNFPYYKAETAYPEVVFPSGNYLITRPIVIAATRKSMNLSIKGNGDATIIQKYPDKDIFYMHYGYRQCVNNITFKGGKTQIKFFSRNFNRAQLLIKNCNFIDSSSYAVDDALKGPHHSKIVAPYKITWKNSLPYATQVNVDQLPDIFYTSSILHINNSIFTNCMKAVRAFSDWGIINRCKITTNPKMQGAAIYSRGVLKIKDTNCYAKNKSNNSQRFVDNIQAGVILQNVKINTDGKGMCPVYNRRIYDNGGLYNVYAIIDSCNIKAADSIENCFVYCEEVPNLICITNSKELSGKRIPAIAFRPKVTKKYLQYVSFPELVKRLPELSQIYGYMVSMPRVYTIPESKYKHNFAFCLYDNKNLDCKLSTVLGEFNKKALPEHIAAKFYVKNRTTSNKTATHKSLNVYSFGAIGNGRNDDTAAIQKAINAASQKANTELIFPGGLYKITKTIALPERLAIRGAGMACFKGSAGLETLFCGKNVQNISFYNIGFFNIQNAVKLTTKNTTKADILFEHCFFSKIYGIAVNCLSGSGKAGENNLTELRITDCIYGISGQIVCTNAQNTLFNYNWISLYSNKKNKDTGSIVNLGRMQIIDNIGVPRITAPSTWINNKHIVIVENMRFGGEGKFTKNLIENNSDQGKIYMRYSWLCCDKGAVVLCNEIPTTVALFANFGPPVSYLQTMIKVKKHIKTKTINFLFEKCNIIPSNFSFE